MYDIRENSRFRMLPLSGYTSAKNDNFERYSIAKNTNMSEIKSV